MLTNMKDRNTEIMPVMLIKITTMNKVDNTEQYLEDIIRLLFVIN